MDLRRIAYRKICHVTVNPTNRYTGTLQPALFFIVRHLSEASERLSRLLHMFPLPTDDLIPITTKKEGLCPFAQPQPGQRVKRPSFLLLPVRARRQ
jgi:hypothetical protein